MYHLMQPIAFSNRKHLWFHHPICCWNLLEMALPTDGTPNSLVHHWIPTYINKIAIALGGQSFSDKPAVYHMYYSGIVIPPSSGILNIMGIYDILQYITIYIYIYIYILWTPLWVAWENDHRQRICSGKFRNLAMASKASKASKKLVGA